jgi:hypothetical protein
MRFAFVFDTKQPGMPINKPRIPRPGDRTGKEVETGALAPGQAK